jgi:hypothetical protein
MTTDIGSGTGISGTLTRPAPMRLRLLEVRVVAVRRVPVVWVVRPAVGTDWPDAAGPDGCDGAAEDGTEGDGAGAAGEGAMPQRLQ